MQVSEGHGYNNSTVLEEGEMALVRAVSHSQMHQTMGAITLRCEHKPLQQLSDLSSWTNAAVAEAASCAVDGSLSQARQVAGNR